jgi:hypothetical protein
MSVLPEQEVVVRPGLRRPRTAASLVVVPVVRPYAGFALVNYPARTTLISVEFAG